VSGVEESFDYVVIGAGSAGCAIAARLVEPGTHRVLVLEAGPWDRSPWVRVPIGFFKMLSNPRYNWGYEAEFNESPDARKVPWPRGRIIGGSSSINGLVYVRGQREDFDGWEAASAAGWGWAGVGPYFERAESGPVGVSGPRYTHPLCDAFIATAARRGIARVQDFNGASQAGTGYYSLNTRNGRRSSAAFAYLHPSKRHPNLAIRTESLVERLDIRDGRLRGVWYRHRGQRHFATVRREAILSAGAIGSPQLLQLSGVGPADVLEGARIQVVAEVPAVGRNLQDHFASRVMARVQHSRTLNEMSRSWFSQAGMGLQYAFARRGPLTLGAVMAGLFTSATDDVRRPDVQLLFGPLSTDDPSKGLHDFPGMTMTVCPLRPRSRGWLAIRSADPSEYPRIVANYLEHEHDRELLLKGLRLARELFDTEPLSRFVADEYLPGRDRSSDDQLLEFARERGGSIYHPCGTCRMGEGPDTVVDPRLKVHGVAGLRVADASVMPAVLSGNINAACMMIGEKAADLIKADQ
jgi:choline dehydrogenase